MSFFKNKPIFIFLLSVFFVFHGSIENYDFVPITDALLLIFIYTIAVLAITCLSWLFYRDFIKASLIALLIMAYHFLFGSMQDMLRKYFEQSFFARYSFILPISFLFFLIIVIKMKRRKKPFRKLLFALNCLFPLLILIDAGWLISKMTTKERSISRISNNDFINCDTCKRSDIYFIILDGYSGNAALKERFNFDNKSFEDELQSRGFYIASNSTSNYNYTPFSIASILNMDYLELNMKTKGAGSLNYSYKMIKNNRAMKFLQTDGYKFYNYSIFDFTGQPALNSENFLPVRTKLITSQTFISRVWNDILFNIATGKLKMKNIKKKIIYSHLHNNDNFIRQTKDLAASKTASPKFVYTHLMMPHYPYYFDSNGQPLPFDSLVEGKEYNEHNYIEYLQYCNKKILGLTDAILKTSSSPPVIILLGDHGFRHFQKKEDRKYCFMNLSAVYLPNRNYSNFYSTMSTVNLFPTLFNSQFRQQMPLKKDSTIYLWD